MSGFDYFEPESIAEALDLLARDDTTVLAGGTSLMLLVKQGLVRPARVVGLRRIEALHGIARRDALRINALVTIADAARSPDVRAHAPALSDAFGLVATVRIRDQATVGGCLAHADPASDPPTMLLALDAIAVARGPAGERRVPLDELFTDVFSTSLAPGELLVAVEVPPLADGTRSRYLKFLPRTVDDYGTVCVGATLRLEDGRVRDTRIALGAVGTRPLRARRAEDALRGATPTPALLGEVAALAAEDTDPFDDARGSAAYKRQMVRVWVERTLRALVA